MAGRYTSGTLGYTGRISTRPTYPGPNSDSNLNRAWLAREAVFELFFVTERNDTFYYCIPTVNHSLWSQPAPSKKYHPDRTMHLNGAVVVSADGN